jgi:5-methylthioadenosine/S-adenosylhomocysteine deaminase
MDSREQVDILIENGCVITIDPQRRVIDSRIASWGC